MMNSQTKKLLVLVVGAGASEELSLPIGKQLTENIADLLDFRIYNQKYNGDELIDLGLKIIAEETGLNNGKYQRLKRAANKIWKAMPQAISIDNFIDNHRSDQDISIVAKLAIVRSILDAESKSPIYVTKENSRTPIDFKSLHTTWFHSFFQLLTENCEASEVVERFQHVAIICFNYDRCIEHYLYLALQNYYSIDAGQASEIMKSLTIYRPYGKVGNLPWQSSLYSIEFGSRPNPKDLVYLSNQILTFTEGTDQQKSDIDSIRNTLSTADRIAFLGFAFHRLNINLLFPYIEGLSSRNIPVYATAHGISNADIQEIKADLSRNGGIHPDGLFIRSDLTCRMLYSEYWRSLALV